MNCIQFVLLLFWHYALATAVPDAPIVQLPNGKLLGKGNGDHYSYESIPYAEPPLGELRFEAPKPYRRMWTETFNATEAPAACMQWSEFANKSDRLLGIEDCLVVSVYVPKNKNITKFSVVAHLHGGSFMFGNVRIYGHKNLMANNLIMVKINYRVGPLGFLSTEDKQMPGNFGLKDQRLALRWIKNNIAHFGGDPENILVTGLSAGGASVHLQLLQKEFEHLAKAAFSISGTALNPWVVQSAARERAIKMGSILGCGTNIDSTVLKACLKSKDAEQIVRAVQHFFVFNYVPFSPFSPVIEPADADEAFLTQHPIDIIKSGNFAQVPWLASYTKEDGGYNAATFLEKQSNGVELIDVLNSRWTELAPYLLFYWYALNTTAERNDYANKLRLEYMGNRNFSFESYTHMERIFTDVLFKNGTEHALQLHAKYGKSAVYGYMYDNPATYGPGNILSKRKDVQFGTIHSDDCFLIFPNEIRPRPIRADEQVIAHHFVKMFEQFVSRQNESLKFSNCEFPNNVGQQELKLLYITSKDCYSMQVDLPDTN
ncbi:esterase-5B-like [Drosophila busckii]|uniref:esterase-5B-like n=1 Tax=Drosophila busckii TaxID=30019 RepID=UPI00083EC41E|nr:esterase-5B-like [Drosophila busckii]